MRIDTDPGKGELSHVCATDQDGAGRAKARHDWGVARRRRAVIEGENAGRGMASTSLASLLVAFLYSN